MYTSTWVSQIDFHLQYWLFDNKNKNSHNPLLLQDNTELRLFLKSTYCTYSMYLLGQNVILSKWYVNTSTICSIPNNSWMYPDSEEIPSMHLTSLHHLLFPTMQCAATSQPKPGWALVDKVLFLKKDIKKRMSNIGADLCEYILGNLTVHCRVDRWHTEHSFSTYSM